MTRQNKLGFILGALAMTLGTFALIYSVLTPGDVSWGYVPGIAVGALVCYFAVTNPNRD